MTQYKHHDACGCGCCEGVENITPIEIYNRTGLDALEYRVGTHGAFLETMIADLTGETLPLNPYSPNDSEAEEKRPLDALKTRARDDFSIALLDVWAVIADVLTFYQERIANEGYLPTAIERRSVLELARLIGYKMRPGVASTVYLAYTLDESVRQTIIPKGTRAQTIPAPGETMQSFETSDDLIARPLWNNLKLRMTQPTVIMQAEDGMPILQREIYLPGTTTPPRPNERILMALGKLPVDPNDPNARTEFVLDDSATYYLFAAQSTQTQDNFQRTRVVLQDSFIEIIQPTAQAARAARRRRAAAAANNTINRNRSLISDQPTHLFNTIKVTFPIDDPLSVFPGPGVFAMPTVGPILVNPYIRVPWQDKLPDAKKPKAGTLVNAAKLNLSPQQTLVADADIIAQALVAQYAQLEDVIFTVLGSEIAPPPDDEAILRRAYVFRKKAVLFGHNAPKSSQFTRAASDNDDDPVRYEVTLSEWKETSAAQLFGSTGGDAPLTAVTLDAEYEDIVPGSLIVLEWHNTRESFTTLYEVVIANTIAAVAFGLSAKATQVWLRRIKGADWTVSSATGDKAEIDHIRSTVVYMLSERLGDPQSGKVLADEPLPDDFVVKIPGQGGEPDREIELDGIYDGLQAGRWITVSGIRTDLPGGVIGSELAMLERVVHRINEVNITIPVVGQDGQVINVPVYSGPHPGDLRHTVLTLASPLNYVYQRDTVVVNANVVEATHGETKNEVLGSGSGAIANQQFTLKQPPGQLLTFIPASNVKGIETSLNVRVNDVLWHEVETLVAQKPTDRSYTTDIDDEGKVTVTFGNGAQGARLPTGGENVRAVYRVGIGKPGNVRAKQINLLATRPAGIKEVINPLPATGGADPESRDQARHNAPLAVRALDRLVSIRDYSDFARTFAGIGKARAERHQSSVSVIVGGEDNIPLTHDSALIRNLEEALVRYGDPALPVSVEIYEALLMVVGANVRVHPDFLWEKVKKKVLNVLLDTFSFNRRDFGQYVTVGEVLAAIQRVQGVEYARVTVLDALTEDNLLTLGAPPPPPSQQPVIQPAPVGAVNTKVPYVLGLHPRVDIEPHQLAYADPKLPDLLLLSEITQ